MKRLTDKARQVTIKETRLTEGDIEEAEKTLQLVLYYNKEKKVFEAAYVMTVVLDGEDYTIAYDLENIEDKK